MQSGHWRQAAHLVPAAALALLLLAACRAPTALPAITSPTQAGTASPTPPAGTTPLPPRPTPTYAPTLLGEPLPPPAPQPVHVLPAPVCCLAADPFDPRAVYALLANDHFYVSPDSGRTWQPLPLPHQEEIALDPPSAAVGQANIYLSPHRPGLIFVRARDRLLRSVDRGQTWEEIAAQVGAWTVSEQEDRLHLYAWWSGAAPGDHGLFHSADQGETWQPVYPGSFPPAMYIEQVDSAREGMLSLAADPGWEEFLYAGTQYGIFRSMNGGRTWEPFDTGLPPAADGLRRVPQLLAELHGGMYALTEAPASGGDSEFLLARLAHGEIIPDQDFWEVVNRGHMGGRMNRPGLGFHGIFGLEVDPQEERSLYLATADGLLGSRDGGAHFEVLGSGAARQPIYRVEAAPGSPIHLYLSSAAGFADQPVAWPGLVRLPEEAPPPRYTPEVEFKARQRIGGELTAYAVDQVLGLDPGMAYLGLGPYLALMDVSQETVPDMWSSLDLDGETVREIELAEGRAYLLTGKGTLREVDISDRANPRQLERLRLPNPASILAQDEGGTLVAAERACTQAGCTGGLRFFGTAPGLHELAYLPTGMPAVRLELLGDHLYAFEQDCRGTACSAGLRVLNLSNSAAPEQTAYLELPGPVISTAAEGEILFVAHPHGLLALDISEAAHPRETNPLDLDSLSSGEVSGLALSRGHAYLISGYDSIDIFSLEDPEKPRRVDTWPSEGGLNAAFLVANDRALYIVDTFGEFGYCSSSLLVADLADPANPRLVGGAGSKLGYTCLGEPVLVGQRLYLNDWDGLHILDLDDPFAPRPFADYGVSGEVAGLVADQLRLFWSNQRAADSLYGIDASDPENVSISGPLPSAHTGAMALYWNYLYVPAWQDGLRVLDVFHTESPETLAVLTPEELGGSPTRAVLVGRSLYLALEPGGLRVVDVVEPSRPKLLGRLDLGGAVIQDLAVAGDAAYLLAVSYGGEESVGEVLVVDVEDPAKPRRVRSLPGLPGERPAALATGSGRLYVGGQSCDSQAPGGESCRGSLLAYSLADPLRPERAWELELPGAVAAIEPHGDFVYLAAGEAGVWAVDLRDPDRPALAGQSPVPDGARALAVVNNRVYVAAGPAGLLVLEVERK